MVCLQSNPKTTEGNQHPDRDRQFQHINGTVDQFQQGQQLVISVDGKKKELIGKYKNAGQEWQPKGEPIPVRQHDLIDEELGKVIPYGVYDVSQNQGWVSVEVDHDTAELAVETIRQWWQQMGQVPYPNAGELLITADCGASNSYRASL